MAKRNCYPCLLLLLALYSSQCFTSTFSMNSSTITSETAPLPPDNGVTANNSTVANETASVTNIANSTMQTPLEQRVDQFLSQLPPEVLESTIEPADAGRMLGILFHLKNVVKAARMGGGGKSSLTPLMLQMMASQIGGGGSGGDPSKLHVSLNMKDMMPLVAHFLDSTSRKCMHSGNGTFMGGPGVGGSGGGDTEALLAMISNVFQQQQQPPTPQQIAADKLAAEKAEKGSFDFQQFIMQIATKMIADVASSAISGGRSAT